MTISQKKITVVHFAADWWEHVCPTLRVLAPARQSGLDVIRGNEWDDGKIRIFPDRVAQGDIVVIQRDFPRHAEGYEQIIAQARTLGKPVVYELDDLLTELPDSHPDAEFYKIARAATLQAAAEADVVTTTTTPLAGYLKSFNPNVQLLPNFLVDSLWRFAKPTLPASEDQKRPVTIGYLGSHGHKFDLEMIVPALTHLARRYGDRIIFKFWGIAPPQPLAEIAKVELFQPGLVDYAQFANYFSQQECDIFVAPLQNSLFNRCKSSLKFLEYSALAMPSVCSRIDPYAVIVEHTKNGFLASTGEDWEEYLSCLVESPSLRREIGLAAQRTVRENWLLSNHAMEWDRVYRVALDIATNPLLSPVVKVAREMNRWHGELVGRLAEQKQVSQLFQKQLVEKDEQLKTLSNQLGEKDEQLKTLSNQLSEKEQKIQGLESRLTEQTLAAQALNERLEQSEHTTLALRTELAKIQSSIGWEWLQVAWRTRMRLAPRSGYRERMLSLVVRGARVWRREGIVSLAKKATRKGINKFLRRGLPQVQAIQQPLITFKAEPGIQCPQPAVSVFIPKEDDASSQLVELAKGWLARQTWQLVEAIIWDRGLGIAWRMNDSEIHWEARDIESLCSRAQGRYVCIASLDLLSQSETYLEANLIALESESLTFTVNVNGKSDWAIKQIQSNQLPSSRLITRKDCLRNDGSVDLSAWLAQQQTPVVIGKIITHTVSQADQEELLVFESDRKSVV
jgi:glycosyltransferase involved in cell wall biosynthesis